MKVHLDTDFAGDPDDACALAMLLGWPGVEITGITTTADPDGRRAAYVCRLLALTGNTHVAVGRGAGTSLAGQPMGGIPNHDRYWGAPSLLMPPDQEVNTATALLSESIEAGATVAAIGPLTNLARVARYRSGGLADIPVVAMGGWFEPRHGLPGWGPSADWNIQCDPEAATVVLAQARLTLVPLSTTLSVQLRRRDLPRLESAGALGALLGRQALAYCQDESKTEMALAHRGLPDDLLNFHHDPLAAAVAAGWTGVTRQQMRLVPRYDGDWLSFDDNPDGRLVDVITDVDSASFTDVWLTAVAASCVAADSAERPIRRQSRG